MLEYETRTRTRTTKTCIILDNNKNAEFDNCSFAFINHHEIVEIISDNHYVIVDNVPYTDINEAVSAVKKNFYPS